MLRIFLLSFILWPVYAEAHQPRVVDFPRYEDNVVIEDPQVSQAFYGELDNFPHTYELNLVEAQNIKLQVLVPDIATTKNNKNAIVVQKKPDGGVEKVASIKADEASWESSYEPFGGDTYRRGGTFSGDLEAGEYLIEVSTSENNGKYVLVIGELERLDGGILSLYKGIYEVKKFFGKPAIAVFQSPFYYVPLILLLILLVYGKYRQSKHG